MEPAMKLITPTSSQSFDISAKAVICFGGEVLLLRRPNGLWDLPGGKVRTREQIADGLLREVHEETGLKLSAFYRLSTIPRRRANGRACLMVSYHCSAQHPLGTPKIELSGEHDTYGFFTFEQTATLRLKAHQKRALAAASEFLRLNQAA